MGSGNIAIDIMNRGRIIHLSNKIAHQFEYIMDSRLKEYMTKNGIEAATREEFRQIKSLIKKIYREGSKDAVKQKSKEMLKQDYHFTEEDFEKGKNLDTLMFPELIKAYNGGMYIKAMEIGQVDKLAQENNRTDISYGLRRESDHDILFVMDISKFGQFSVHVKDPSLVAQIKRIYEMPIYRTKTAMLVNYLPDKTRQFIQDSIEDDSLDEERNIPENATEPQKRRARLVAEIKELQLPKGAKHDIAVRAGLGTKNLKRIDQAKDEEER